MSVNVADGSERVVVRWCQAQGDPRAVARAVAGLLLGQLQPSAERRRAYLPASARDDWRTRQSTEPVSFQIAAQRVAAIQWDGSMTSLTRALLDDGSRLEAKNPCGKRQTPQGALVDDERPKRRKPAAVNRRPGEGGLKRRRQGDPTAGLAEYGEVVWRPGSGGAKLGVLELSPTGNAVAVCRLSGRDKNENLVDQLQPLLALENANPETLRYRRALMSVDMSGGRDVRPDDALIVHADQVERDDAAVLDSWHREGWLQHIAFRDLDRMAREILPTELLFRRWRAQEIQVWFADIGRPIDWDSDRLLLRIRQLIATEERHLINRRLQGAAVIKGPLAGRGWLGTTRFGFIRDPQSKELRPDPAQWPFILRAFELADSAAFRNQGSLSTREISRQLAAEGCTFDHDRIRTILGDAIYATGEFITWTRGYPIAQRPIPLPEPVPLDRFQRVQELLALRQGSCSRTPLGEFVLNYVEAVHLKCEGETNAKGWHPLIKGYILNTQHGDQRLYRHSIFTPDGCKRSGRGHRGAFTWERDRIERPIIEEIRRLASHPELIRALLDAERHQLALTETRLSAAERAAIEHEIADLERKRQAAADEWLGDALKAELNLSDYRTLMDGFNTRIRARRNRLEEDSHAASLSRTHDEVRSRYTAGLLDLLTIDTPDDPHLKALRARVFQRLVSRIVIDDSGSGPITITIYGHLVPEDATSAQRDPVLAAADLIDARNQSGRPQLETDLSGRADKSVSSWTDHQLGDLITHPSCAAQAAWERRQVHSTAWHATRGHQCQRDRHETRPAWTHTIHCAAIPSSAPASVNT